MTYSFTWSAYYLGKNVTHIAIYILHCIPPNAQNESVSGIICCMMKFARTAAKNVIF